MLNLFRYDNGRGVGMPGLLGWDPFRLMNDLVGPAPTWVAPVGYVEDDDGLTITFDVPGVDAKDLDITYRADGLVVSGKREGRGEFTHTLRVPDTLDVESASAELKNGVLSIRFGKRPETKPRKIAIQAGDPERALESGDKDAA